MNAEGRCIIEDPSTSSTPWAGIRHVHHLSSRMPLHRLLQLPANDRGLRAVSRITFVPSLKGVRLTPCSERARRLVLFREERASA